MALLLPYNMYKKYLTVAFSLAALSVALGAFGAHALQEKIEAKLLHTYYTATQYLFYHCIAIILAALVAEKYPNKFTKASMPLFVFGIAFFCCSLFLLVTLKANGIETFNWLGAITPLGGICFISGWACLAFGTFKK